MLEISSVPSYRIDKDSVTGYLRAVWSINPEEGEKAITLNPLGGEYCEFLNWACNQRPPVAESFGNLRPNSKYFSSSREVVDYCKEHRRILAVSPEQDLRQLETGMTASGILESVASVPHAEGCLQGNGDHWLRLYRMYEATPLIPSALDTRSDGLWPQKTTMFFSLQLLEKLNEELQDPDSDVRRVSSWPVEKTFVYVDVSDFSKHPVGHQLLIINQMLAITTDPVCWPSTMKCSLAHSDLQASLCIGDGYIFVFSDAANAVYFAAYFAQLTEQLIASELLIEFHFRISVHSGPVYHFWDKGVGGVGRWNYIGKGITEGERVLSAIGKDKDDIVFISAETRRRIQGDINLHPEFDPIRFLQNRGRQPDKHGVLRRVYEVNHTAWIGEQVDLIVRAKRAENK